MCLLYVIQTIRLDTGSKRLEFPLKNPNLGDVINLLVSAVLSQEKDFCSTATNKHLLYVYKCITVSLSDVKDSGSERVEQIVYVQ